MTGTIELTPDQLADLVCRVMRANGIDATMVAVQHQGQLVGYDKVVVYHELTAPLHVYEKPNQEDLARTIYPDVGPVSFAGRNGSGAA
jgi:hypothetical protein